MSAWPRAELLAEEHAERPLLAAVNAEVDVAVRALLKDILLSLAKAAARDTASAEPWVELLAAVVQGGSCWGAAERGAGAGGGGPGLDFGAGGSVAQEGVDGLAMAEEGRLEEDAEAAEAARSGRLDAIGSFGGAVGSPRAPAVRLRLRRCLHWHCRGRGGRSAGVTIENPGTTALLTGALRP